MPTLVAMVAACSIAKRLSLVVALGMVLLSLWGVSQAAGGPVAKEELQWTACTIDRVDDLSIAAFRSTYKGKRPVVFRAHEDNSGDFRDSVTRQRLLDDHGHRTVVTASSNSYSHDKVEMTLGEYIHNHVHEQTLDSLANETYYLFGDTFGPAWDALVAPYEVPVDSANDEGMVTFGVGGRHSGVSFHTHGAAFGEAIIGRKRWFLTEPENAPDFVGSESQLNWVVNRFPDDPRLQPLVCTVEAGFVIYIPGQWHHATLNLDAYNVFVSVFTREKY